MANLFEGVFSKLTLPRRTSGPGTNSSAKRSTHDDSADSVTRLAEHDVYKVISSIRDVSAEYKSLYAEYDEMANDSIIGSALELFADDASQLDGDTGRIVNITSDSKSLRDDLIAFLDSINIDEYIWDWSYELAKNGDKYLKVVRDKSGKIVRFDDVDNPELVLELHHNGVRVNFAEEVLPDERMGKMVSHGPTQQEYIFYGPDEYVHFKTRSTAKSDKLRIDIQDESGNPMIKEYKVIRGKSIIENARGIHRILRLLEDSMLAARIAKAEYFRIYNVEVGANSNPNETRKTISKVKNLFDSKPRIDTNKGTYVSSKVLRPIGDPIFNPVQGGKGSISHETVGGDFEVKSLMDVDYFKNKLFAAIKVPPSYLGFEENLPGGWGDDTLMLQDIRYGRTVKRITSATCRGIEDICNLWLKSNGREADCDKFTVSIVNPSSSEELQRLKELELRIDSVDKIMGITNNFSEYVDQPSLIDKLIEVLVDYPELTDAISSELKKASETRSAKLQEEKDELDRQRKIEEEDRQRELDSLNNTPEVDDTDIEYKDDPLLDELDTEEV